MEKLKVVTLFSGYDSQCMSLDRLHENYPIFDYELILWSEIDKYAIQAHNAIYPQWKDRNLGDVCKIDWSDVPDFDLLTYSSPCQDFSAAGLQKGGIKGSGTRSSLLWECERAIDAKRPKYLLMENVAALVSSKFIKLFNKWQHTLEDYGYTNYAKVLNAKEYGVPQNRERIFMVSVRNDINQKFYFPQPFKLEKRLKDILEDKVDEKYYLSEKCIKGFEQHNKNHIAKDTGFLFQPKTGEDIGCCVRSNAALAPTDNTIIEPTIAAMRGRNPENPSDRSKGTHCEQRLEVGENISNTLTSVQKDNLLVEPKIIKEGNYSPSNHNASSIVDINGISPTVMENHGTVTDIKEPKVEQIGNIVDDTNIGFKNPQRGRIYSPNGIAPCTNSACGMGGGQTPMITYKGKEIKDGDGLYLGTTENFFSGGLEGISRTIKSSLHDAGVCHNFRIRKLTPRECFRLQDVSDYDIDKLMNSGISNSQLYKLAGNSIVVSCLYHIFRKLFIETENDSKQLELFQ